MRTMHTVETDMAALSPRLGRQPPCSHARPRRWCQSRWVSHSLTVMPPRPLDVTRSRVARRVGCVGRGRHHQTCAHLLGAWRHPPERCVTRRPTVRLRGVPRVGGRRIGGGVPHWAGLRRLSLGCSQAEFAQEGVDVGDHPCRGLDRLRVFERHPVVPRAAARPDGDHPPGIPARGSVGVSGKARSIPSAGFA